MAECFPDKSFWHWNERQDLPGSVKCFEQSEGLGTVLYKNVPLQICGIVRYLSGVGFT